MTLTRVVSACILASLSTFGQAQVTDVTECFDRYGNCDIIDYKPFNSTWRIRSEAECVRLCGVEQKGRCISLVYDVRQYICHMYDQDGTEYTAFLIPSFKKTYYKLRSPTCIDATTTTTTTTVATTTEEITTTTTEASVTGECEEDESPFFFEAEATALESSDSVPVIYTDLAADECQYVCELNADLDTADTVPCLSYTFIEYDDLSTECFIYDDRVKPLGSVSIISDDLAISYEKFCVNTDIANDFCADERSFPAFVGKDIEGAFETKTIEGLENGRVTCFIQCVLLTDFSCRSYSYAPKTDICVLKDVSRDDRPTEDFVDAAGIIYGENLCVIARKAVKTNTKSQKTKSQQVSKKSSKPSAPRVPQHIQPPGGPPPDLLFGLDPQEFGADPRSGVRRIHPNVPYQVWSEWSECQEVSGLRVKARVKVCTDGTLNCPGDRLRLKPCLEP